MCEPNRRELIAAELAESLGGTVDGADLELVVDLIAGTETDILFESIVSDLEDPAWPITD